MTKLYTISIQNGGSHPLDFVVFQQQPVFTNSGVQPSISSNSLGSGHLAPSASSGTSLQFQYEAQVYAGAGTNKIHSNSLLAPTEYSKQPIALAGTADQPADHTSLSVDPFGLSAPRNDASVPAGKFGISIPSFTPSPAQKLVCGVTVCQSPATYILSSFLSPEPSRTVYCAPAPIFYVSLGTEQAGDPVTYDPSHAGCCDFTTGYSHILATYNADGTFTVTGS